MKVAEQVEKQQRGEVIQQKTQGKFVKSARENNKREKRKRTRKQRNVNPVNETVVEEVTYRGLRPFTGTCEFFLTVVIFVN